MPARPLAGRISFPLSQLNRYEIPLFITPKRRRDALGMTREWGSWTAVETGDFFWLKPERKTGLK